MVQTVQKNIRATPEQWERIEKADDERRVSTNQLLVELAMEAAGRGDEIEEIARNISKIAPDLPPDSSDDTDEGG